MTIEDVKKIIRPLQRRVMLMVGRVVLKSVSEAMKVQASILSEEVRDDMELVQHYGFSSRPKEGAEGVSIFVSGNRDHGLIIATKDKQYEIPLESGEVALWTDEGDAIHLKRGKIISVKAQSKLEIECPEVTISGKLTVTGEVQGNGKSLSTHTHGAGALVAPNGPVTGSTGTPS